MHSIWSSPNFFEREWLKASTNIIGSRQTTQSDQADLGGSFLQPDNFLDVGGPVGLVINLNKMEFKY